MRKKISIRGKIALISVILLFGMGSANAAVIDIDISGTPVVGVSTINIIKVNFTDFTSDSPYFITVFNDTNSDGVLGNGDLQEYKTQGWLVGLPVETKYVDWVPQSTGLHWVVSGGVNYTVYVSDSEQTFPVPEMNTIVLTSAGILGLMGLTRMRRKD